MTNSRHSSLRLAIDLAGGQKALADLCGCTKQNIHQALATGRGLPAAYVDKVSAALKLPRHALRPDLYPAPVDGEM